MPFLHAFLRLVDMQSNCRKTDTLMASLQCEYFGDVSNGLIVKTFWSTAHTYTVSQQCGFLHAFLMIVDMESHCCNTDTCMISLQCEYFGDVSNGVTVKTLLSNAHTCTVSHQCGF